MMGTDVERQRLEMVLLEQATKGHEAASVTGKLIPRVEEDGLRLHLLM